ncbi:GNAT family N-acetyltransferase [Actinomycetospora sp. C-140]
MADEEIRVDLEHDTAVLRVDGAEAGHVDLHHRHAGNEVPAAIVLVHTEVDDAYAGRGLGGRLVRAVFDAARAEGLPVVPRCPYAQRWLRSHPEYLADVAPHDREELGLDTLDTTEEAS